MIVEDGSAGATWCCLDHTCTALVKNWCLRGEVSPTNSLRHGPES